MMEKKTNEENDKLLPVYEAEIISSNDEDDKQIEPAANPVNNSIIQKFARAASSIVAVVGFIAEIRSYFPGKSKRGTKGCRSTGKQRNRSRRKG